MDSSSLNIKTDNVGQSSGTKLFSKASSSKKKSVASQSFVRSNSSGVDSSKSPQLMKSSHIKVKSALFGSKSSSSKSSSFHSNFNGHNGSLHPLDIESGNPSFKSSHNIDVTPEHGLGESSVLKSARAERNGASVDTAGLTITDEPENETLRKLRSFKQFDIVTDISDHYFGKNKSSMKQVSFSFLSKNVS